MKLICVGGLSSGCGKTSVVCLLLQALPGWAAMKVTPSRRDDVCPRGEKCEACQPPDGPFEVTIDEEIVERHLTDTSRFREAGASHVAFVRGLPEHLPEALLSALERLVGAPGVIIESTSMMPMVGGLRILVAREGLSDAKDSARNAVQLANLFVVNQDPDRTGAPDFAAIPLIEELEGRVVTACAALGPDDPRNRKLVQYCRRFVQER